MCIGFNYFRNLKDEGCQVGAKIKDEDLKKKQYKFMIPLIKLFLSGTTQHKLFFFYSQLSLFFIKLLSQNGKRCLRKNKQSGQTLGHHLVNIRCFYRDSLQGPTINYIFKLLPYPPSTSSLDEEFQLDSWWHISHC